MFTLHGWEVNCSDCPFLARGWIFLKRRHEDSLRQKSASCDAFGLTGGWLLSASTTCGWSWGNRTLVQTRKTQAFYMLIFDSIFVQRQNQSHQPMPYPLKLHLRCEASDDYPRFGCTTWPECFGATASEWCHVPAPGAGIKLRSTVLQSSSESVIVFAR